MIYFIRNVNTGAIKIGTSLDPAKRLSSLQTAVADELVLLGTLEGDRVLERKLHVRFSMHHIRGEWFKGVPEMVRAVELIISEAHMGANVWTECQRRGNRRDGLNGLQVTVIGEHWASTINHSFWDENGVLMLNFVEGRRRPANECVLRQPWPEPHPGFTLEEIMSVL